MANKLESIISPNLEKIEASFQSLHQFDPKLLDEVIRISLPPFAITSITNNLYQSIKQDAPNVRLEINQWNHHTLDKIMSDDIFLGIHYGINNTPKEVARQEIGEITHRVIVRKDHPLSGTVGSKDCENFRIASLISPGWNDDHAMATRRLSQYGVNINVDILSENLLTLIDVISSTDMLLPHSNLFPINSFPHLKSLKFTIDKKEITNKLYNYNYLKNNNSPKKQWLEKTIKTCIVEKLS